MTHEFFILHEFYKRVLTIVQGWSDTPEELLDPDVRRRCGAHYTTEENILKVIRPLFLDDLQAE